MDYLSSTPFIYEDGITYVACKYDWSDVEEKIDYILTNWGHLQSFITENMRRKFSEEYSEKKLAIHIHNIFKNLNNE
jgi:glycosyltransferase involved in cell wall biosynthesis